MAPLTSPLGFSIITNIHQDFFAIIIDMKKIFILVILSPLVMSDPKYTYLNCSNDSIMNHETMEITQLKENERLMINTDVGEILDKNSSSPFTYKLIGSVLKWNHVKGRPKADEKYGYCEVAFLDRMTGDLRRVIKRSFFEEGYVDETHFQKLLDTCSNKPFKTISGKCEVVETLF